MKSSDREAVSSSQKAGIWGGCGASALLALPAAMSFGGVLVGPAAAQGVIGTNQTTTVNLGNYAPGPVSITAGTTISPVGGAGIEGAGRFWSLSNAGVIDAQAGDGVRLDAGGVVVNEVGSVIDASGYGVRVTGAVGSVTNSGAITALYDGISLNRGGEVANALGGTISGGHIGVYTGNGAGVVANAGVISAETGDAVSLYAGGSFSNAASGRVQGGYSGVYAGGNFSTVQNAGTIGGTSFGVYLSGASGVSNSGTISGGVDGIIDVGAGGTVGNSGVIEGGKVGLRMAADARVENEGRISGGVTGVKIGAGSVLENEAGGVILGGAVGLQAAGDVVIDNAGSIGGAVGIVVSGGQSSILNTGTVASSVRGGDAIELGAGGADVLTLGTGSVIEGDIDGENSASQVLLMGGGTLASDVIGFGPGSGLSVAPGAEWVASGSWTVASVVNAGILQPGLVGAPLNLTGSFTQLSTGVLRVVVTPEGVSQFNVTGPVQLGGKLVYVLAPGVYAPVSESFLSSNGPVTGSFAQVVVQSPAETGQSDPPLAMALASAASTAAVVVSQNFTVGPEDDGLFANANQVSVLDAQRAGDVLLGHAEAENAGPCPAGGVMANGGGTQAGIAGALAGAFCGAGGWLETSGTRMDVSDGYDADVAGFLAGLDRRVGAAGTRVGLAVGYDAATLTDDAGGKASINTFRVGVYGAQPLGGFVVTGDVMGGFASIATTRATGAGDAAGRGDGTSVAGGVEVLAAVIVR